MIAIELVQPGTRDTTRSRTPTRSARSSRTPAQNGVLLLTAGTYGNVLRFLPSLAVTDELIEDGLRCSTTASRPSADPWPAHSPSQIPSNSPWSNEVVSSSPGTPAPPSCSPPKARCCAPSAMSRTPIFPRSCLKPFQAVAVMTSGVTLRGEDAAIATASHSGTAAHVALVQKAPRTRIAAGVGARLPACCADRQGRPRRAGPLRRRRATGST